MKVKVQIDHTFSITEEWEEEYATKNHIEFYYNDGTSCADNVIKRIMKYKKEIHASCLCPLQSSKVIAINGVEVENEP